MVPRYFDIDTIRPKTLSLDTRFEYSFMAYKYNFVSIIIKRTNSYRRRDSLICYNMCYFILNVLKKNRLTEGRQICYSPLE